MMRSQVLAVVLSLAGLVAIAQQPPINTFDPQATAMAEIRVVQRVNAATDKALVYLASKQRPDGGWVNNQAVNGLAILAFLGRGHTPGRGPYKLVLEKAKQYLLRTAQPSGYISYSTMYEHGLATLALAELYGMDPDPQGELETKLRKAVALIVSSQSQAGGWRYSPQPSDQDLSVTVIQIVALRAANNAMIPVDEKVIRRASDYVRSCAAPAGQGGFGYTGPGSGPHTSAAGVLSLQLLGQQEDAAVSRALQYLSTVPVVWSSDGPQYFFYFHYYAIQANYQAGGKHWNDWHPRIRELLLEKQNADGSWDAPPKTAEVEATVGANRIYTTAMASLVLDIYMHFLPAYQR
jgi:hypothetical protein